MFQCFVAVFLLLLCCCIMTTVRADDDGSIATNRPTTGPVDRFYGSPGPSSSTKSSNKLARIRCPLRSNDVFIRLDNGDVVPFDPQNQTQQQVVSLRGSSANGDVDKEQQQQPQQPQLFHPCWCTEYYGRPMEYCPANLQLCVVNGQDGPIECQSHSSSASLAQVVWPTGLFYILIVMAVFLCTHKRVYLYQYVQRKALVACRCRRRRDDDDGHDTTRTTEDDLLVAAANRIMAAQGRPSLLGEDFIRRERRRLEREQIQNNGGNATTTNKPKRQKIQKPHCLKTKRFVVSSGGNNNNDDDRNHEDDDDDEPECAICLGSLEHGDCVGDIPCGHLFHKDCLKTWVQRRKRCPLCQDVRLLTTADADEHCDVEAAAPNRSSALTSGSGMSSTESDTTSEADNEQQQRQVGSSSSSSSSSLDLEEPSNDLSLGDLEE